MSSESVASTRIDQSNSSRRRNRVRTRPRLTMSTSSPPSPEEFSKRPDPISHEETLPPESVSINRRPHGKSFHTYRTRPCDTAALAGGISSRTGVPQWIEGSPGPAPPPGQRRQFLARSEIDCLRGEFMALDDQTQARWVLWNRCRRSRRNSRRTQGPSCGSGSSADHRRLAERSCPPRVEAD